MRAVSTDAKIVVEPVVELVPLSIAAEHPAVTFVKRLVGRNDHSKVAYGTEAGLFSERAGIASVVCGPGSIQQAHKPDEYLALSEIDRCIGLISKIADELERPRRAMVMTRAFDAVVVGAGIAGVASAYYLQKADFSVALIDRYHPGWVPLAETPAFSGYRPSPLDYQWIFEGVPVFCRHIA